MTADEAKRIIGVIATRYPTPALPLETLHLWAGLIADLEYTHAHAVALAWMRSHDQVLDPARLRAAVADRQAAARGMPYLAPDEAWGFVEQCFTRIGSYRDFPDTHPLVARVVGYMGWKNLCLSENQVAERAHFLQLYRDLLKRATAAAAASPGALAIGDADSAERLLDDETAA